MKQGERRLVEYRLGDHDFSVDEYYFRRCSRCGLASTRWSGDGCPLNVTAQRWVWVGPWESL